MSEKHRTTEDALEKAQEPVVLVNPVLVVAIHDMERLLKELVPHGDFAYTVAIQGHIVAAHNLKDGCIDPMDVSYSPPVYL